MAPNLFATVGLMDKIRVPISTVQHCVVNATMCEGSPISCVSKIGRVFGRLETFDNS